MIRNKKLISLLCALAMVVTMLSGLTITASAAGESFTLSTPAYQSDGTITLDVGYAGMPTLNAGEIIIVMPDEVTAVKSNPAGTAELYDAATHTYTYRFSYGSSPVSSEDGTGKITTLTITTETLFSDKTITIADGSQLLDNPLNAPLKVGSGLGTASAALPRDPDAPPKTDATPGAVATPDPNGKKPLDPDVTSTIGFVFGEPTANDDYTEITVDVNYVGMPTLNAGEFIIVMPDEVTEVTSNPAGTAELYDAATHKYTYRFSYGSSPVSSADGTGKVTTLTLKLSKPMTTEKQIAFQEGTQVLDDPLNAPVKVGEGNMLASNVRLPYAVPESFDIPFSDVLSGGDVTDAPAHGATEKDSAYFIIPKVTVTDDAGNTKDAVYDEDYVVVLETDNGDIVLTKDQYENFMNGYLGADNIKALCQQAGIDDINDVIGKLKVRAYNNTAKVSAQLVKKSSGEIVDEGEAGTTPEKNNAADGSISPLKTSKDIYVGDSVSLKFTIKPAKDKSGAEIPHDGVKDSISVNVDGASYNVLSATGITVESKAADGTVAKERLTINEADTDYPLTKITTDKTYTFKFTPLAKTAKDEPIEFTVKYLDANGHTTTATASYKVKEKSTGSGSSSSGSGSNDTSGSSGVLANGNTGSLSGGLLGSFTDMAGYDWAQQAVSVLAMKNIVSGRGDGTFDPGGQITRAEYAQMLINAIGKSSDYADTTFNDVPTDAGFYHNVAVAAQLGIVSGYGDGNFGPYDLITREQMALMTQKAAIVMNKSLNGAAVAAFSDDADIADWAKAAVYDLANVGIINGMGDGTFAPKANATRAQAAVIIYSAFVK